MNGAKHRETHKRHPIIVYKKPTEQGTEIHQNPTKQWNWAETLMLDGSEFDLRFDASKA